ncbi:SPOR domain-containing protein [Aquabacterium sp.]|uniref:SPOR domain-containing protein n=1 Tax=Aquabacterium sp. TaxID=1872578 RepID=UPI0037848385
MALLSFFKRKDESPAAADAPDAVATARTRARRRLIGATVLLGVGVIGFPLLFETQPRPVPVDIPIEIPRRESVPPLSLPPAAPASAATIAVPPAVTEAAVPEPVPATRPVPAASRPGTVPMVTEREADQGREVAAAPARPVASSPAPKPASAPKPVSTPQASPPKPSADGQRAQALLDGKPAAAAAKPAAEASANGARIVVQVGAYTDADKLREARQKVEKLGMKTYTQVIEADGGKRTRVRVGPFATRDEADKAAARIKAAGLPVAILTL